MTSDLLGMKRLLIVIFVCHFVIIRERRERKPLLSQVQQNGFIFDENGVNVDISAKFKALNLTGLCMKTYCKNIFKIPAVVLHMLRTITIYILHLP